MPIHRQRKQRSEKEAEKEIIAWTAERTEIAKGLLDSLLDRTSQKIILQYTYINIQMFMRNDVRAHTVYKHFRNTVFIKHQ